MKSQQKPGRIVVSCFLLLLVGLVVACERVEGKRLVGQNLTDLEGNRSEILFTENRPLIINFWASWCRPCFEEIPLLIETRQKLGEAGPALIGVVLDSPPPLLLQQLKMNYPNVRGFDDLGRKLAKQVGLDPDAPYLPYTLFVDSNRNIVYVHRGILDRQTLEKALAALN